MLTNEDLYKHLYDLPTLLEHIYSLSLVDILQTQHLTPDFCVDYILNPDFQLTPEEETIDIHMVQKWQPHLDIGKVNIYTLESMLFKKKKLLFDFCKYI